MGIFNFIFFMSSFAKDNKDLKTEKEIIDPSQSCDNTMIDWMKPQARMLLMKRLKEVFPKIKMNEVSRIINREERNTCYS